MKALCKDLLVRDVAPCEGRDVRGDERGVFGAPFFFVDGGPFWGHDRLGHVDEWLASEGW